jgi:hypothetical protein
MRMKNITKFFMFCSVALLLMSCQDVVQIKLDQGSKLYVIDAFVNNLRQNQIIRVTTSDSYFSDRPAPAVPNAVVLLTDLTKNKQYTFAYTGDGNYTYSLASIDTISFVNHQYKLEVTIDGYVYSSMATQKRTALIDSISTISGGGFGPPTKDTSFICLLHARDKADNNPDYYWVKTYRNDTLFSDPSALNVCIDGTGGPVMNAPTDSIDFTPPATFLGFKPFRRKDICKVEIHSIAKETYYFFIQASNQINNGGLFATTPENVKTNIITPGDAKTKAVGWFNMATVATASKVIK